MKKSSLILWIVLCLGTAQLTFPQEKEQPSIDELKKEAPKVYIDCRFCDIDYIRREITFVNYVRDRKEADVHVLITTQPTGSGGTEYTLTFIGRRDFSDIKDTLGFGIHYPDGIPLFSRFQ